MEQKQVATINSINFSHYTKSGRSDWAIADFLNDADQSQ